MNTYITIDGGTSSTRVNFFKNGEILDTVKLDIGARACVGNRKEYECKIKCAIDEIILRNKASGVERILASGMITSEFGLCNLPHIFAPAGISEMHKNMHEQSFSEISSVPFVFVRGVKTKADSFENTDMMSGDGYYAWDERLE